MWGIAVWSLGNLVYDMGYQSYRNPYPAPPVQNTYVTYTQPVSVAAAANPPGDAKAAELAETLSNEALEQSRAAFKRGDYLAASKAVDEAIGHTPGDVTLHEYRALVFFALGKYSDAAGVLNPVLASGPGWSWDTMSGFYDNSAIYSEQLRKLETYAKGAPEKADTRFLLGYHYMVCGHMEKANAEFSKAVELQPADTISRQLRDLTAASIPDAGESDAEPPARPDPVKADQLVGTWVSDRGMDGKVTFTLATSGDYTWSFMNAGQSSELKGTYGLNDKGLLVLTSDDTQMVSAVEIKDGRNMHFILIGAPDGDPGLDFSKN
jgi:tetratricopeptide (TPR) repeat protein